MRRHLVRIVLGLGITALFAGHAAQFYRLAPLERLDGVLYDLRVRLTMPGEGDPRVVIVDIDEKSLAQVGRWPWSRNLMAQLVDRLFDQYGAAVVGFDMVWAEPDASSGKPLLDELAQKELKGSPDFQAIYRRLRPALDYDALFAASLKGRAVVLGHYFSSDSTGRLNVIPPPVLAAGTFQGQPRLPSQWAGFTGNLPELARSAAGGGHINPVIDADGVVRRVPLLAELDGAYYEALSLAMVRAWLARQAGSAEAPPIVPRFEHGSGLEQLQVGPLGIAVDPHAAALVPYAGPRFSFRYVSIADALAGRIAPGSLKDKLVLVGTSAHTLSDIRATPVASVFPGVEIHANLISGMLNGTLKRQPGYVLAAELLLVLACGISLSLLLPGLSALGGSLVVALTFALLLGLDVLLWNEGLMLPAASLMLMLAAVYTMSMAYGYFVESRVRRQVAHRFGQYVPPEVVQQIVANPDRYSMEPRAAELTILFADVRGFTGISEALRPDELREYINAYLTDMSAIIRGRHHGTLDKYIGDAIMAFWGAPVDNPGHARAAVLAALDMQKGCKILNAMFEARGWPALEIGVGLNTGNVRVGDMGSKVRLAYTVMGDAVNVASRLEGRTKHYAVGILAGEAVRRAVDDVLFREVDRVQVKGRDTALTIYEPIGLVADVPPAQLDEIGLWQRALLAYRERRWDEASALLGVLQQKYPGCGLYAVFARRVAGYRLAPPPEDWDGVTRFDEK